MEHSGLRHSVPICTWTKSHIVSYRLRLYPLWLSVEPTHGLLRYDAGCRMTWAKIELHHFIHWSWTEEDFWMMGLVAQWKSIQLYIMSMNWYADFIYFHDLTFFLPLQTVQDRYVRQYFYDLASEATLEATVLCSRKQITNRMKLTVMFPEMNPSMDSYRCVV